MTPSRAGQDDAVIRKAVNIVARAQGISRVAAEAGVTREGKARRLWDLSAEMTGVGR